MLENMVNIHYTKVSRIKKFKSAKPQLNGVMEYLCIL